MPSAVAVALTFGSFGDILEAAKIAKRIVDVLRKSSGGTQPRQALISTLEGMCDDMARLTHVFEAGYFTDRLWIEVDLSRSLVEEFYAKIKLYQAAGVIGIFRRALMVVSEETELALWRARILDRRAALRDLLRALNSMQLHEVEERVGRVASQVQYVGSKVDNVEAIGTLGVVISAHLSGQVFQMGSEIRQVASDIHQVGTEVQRMIGKLPVHDMWDSVFSVVDPLGLYITIQLSHCNNFNDLDRLLKAYLHNKPEAGSIYVDRGDYNIVSSEGVIIPHARIGEKLIAGTRLEMSIIKLKKERRPTRQTCPQCGQTSGEVTENGWVHCAERTCGARYQISAEYTLRSLEKPTVSTVEEIVSPQISEQDTQAELFRRIEMVYVTEWLSIASTW